MISILIPIYNGIEFFNQSLMSVLLQEYKKWELIVGINGIKENELIANNILLETLQHLNKNKGDYDITIKFYETKGKQNTLNEMVKDAKYNYIALLDVDDIWTCDKLYKQSMYLGLYDVIGTMISYFGNMRGSPNLPLGDITNFDFFIGNPLINSSIIIKKEDAYWDPNCCIGLDDYDMWFRLKLVKNRCFYNLSDILCHHRVHPNSCFNNDNYKYVDELKSQWKKYNK